MRIRTKKWFRYGGRVEHARQYGDEDVEIADAREREEEVASKPCTANDEARTSAPEHPAAIKREEVQREDGDGEGARDRKSVVKGKRVSVRVELGGRRNL